MANMIINLPFTALRAFEAVARHGGFSSAAHELGVSQSAISQHVKSLEQWLGQDLLIRGSRQSVPTPEGNQLADAISDGLGRISEVCSQLRSHTQSDNALVISCLPGFAYTWLFPRLMRFDMAHPDISISITTDTGNRPFSGTEADIGITYGLGKHPGLSVAQLIKERLFPVCSPNLLAGAAPLQSVQDLRHHTLLQNENLDFGGPAPTWNYWAQHCGVTLPANPRTRMFGQSNLVIAAAIQGVGVALGREPLVIDALQDGRLVRPFAEITDSPTSYWIAHRPDIATRPKIQKFLHWIHAEVQTQPDIPETIQT